MLEPVYAYKCHAYKKTCSLLGSTLIRRGVLTAAEGTIRAGQMFNAAN